MKVPEVDGVGGDVHHEDGAVIVAAKDDAVSTATTAAAGSNGVSGGRHWVQIPIHSHILPSPSPPRTKDDDNDKDDSDMQAASRLCPEENDKKTDAIEDGSNCSSKTRITMVRVSNPHVPLPVGGLECRYDFLSSMEQEEIASQIAHTPFVWEGFEQRRKVWRFHKNSIPSSLLHLACRIESEWNWIQGCTSKTTNNNTISMIITVEEYPAAKWNPSGDYASHQRVTTFEAVAGSAAATATAGTTTSASEKTTASIFLAQIPLLRPAIQHLNRPLKRIANHWKLTSSNHQTDLWMPPGSLWIKSGSCLFDWRYQLRAAAASDDSATDDMATTTTTDDNNHTSNNNNNNNNNNTVLVVRFYPRLLPPEQQQTALLQSDNNTMDDRTTTTMGDNNAPRPSYEEEESNSSSSGNAADSNNDTFGYIPNPGLLLKLRATTTAVVPPLSELLTIVITTSPIQSHPSTEVIEKCMETFLMAGPDFAYSCRKIIVCDGVRVASSSITSTTTTTSTATTATVSKKHANAKQAMRNGIVTDDQAARYETFKQTLIQKCRSAKPGTLFGNTVVEELDERQGYGFALKHALIQCVSTPYVCVIQHDRTFMRPTPMKAVLECMVRHPGIKYVGFSMRSNLSYRDIFNGKYGRWYATDFRDMIQRPPELLVDAAEYGPNSRSTRAMAEYCPPAVWKSIQSITTAYWTSHQYLGQQEWLLEQQQQQKQQQQNPPLEQLPFEDTTKQQQQQHHQMSLIPTLFWYDNIHVCETAHYRDFIFHPSYKMVARGGFVEDKLSPVLIRTVERLGLREGHSRFGCYLLDDHSGVFFTGHLDGGAYLTSQQKQKQIPNYNDPLKKKKVPPLNNNNNDDDDNKQRYDDHDDEEGV